MMARRYNGEIINADAMQVYRFMDIGTAKPEMAQRGEIPHHLLDVVNPDEDFNAAIFIRLATEVVRDLEKRGKRIFVVGGTGLYIKTLTQGLFKGPGANFELRKEYKNRIRLSGLDALYLELRQKDIRAAQRIHPHDSVRIIRALEIVEMGGNSIVDRQQAHAFADRPYDSLKIGLMTNRKSMYDGINRRCRDMITSGLVGEVERLLEMGFSAELKPMQSLGYRHIVNHIGKQHDLETALDLMMRDTRRYAKRQLTWFRADGEIDWYEPRDTEKIGKRIEAFLRKDG